VLEIEPAPETPPMPRGYVAEPDED
jgi:hypothetical protein